MDWGFSCTWSLEGSFQVMRNYYETITNNNDDDDFYRTTPSSTIFTTPTFANGHNNDPLLYIHVLIVLNSYQNVTISQHFIYILANSVKVCFFFHVLLVFHLFLSDLLFIPYLYIFFPLCINFLFSVGIIVINNWVHFHWISTLRCVKVHWWLRTLPGTKPSRTPLNSVWLLGKCPVVV